MSIESLTEKIGFHWPAWVTLDGFNYARNRALAESLNDVISEIGQLKENLLLKNAKSSYPIMIGVRSNPGEISGATFFYIDKSILIKDNKIIPGVNRKHVLNYRYDEQNNRKSLGIDSVNQTTFYESGLVEVNDINAKPIYLLVDFDKLPFENIDEEIIFVPIYSEDYLELIAYDRKIKRWASESDDHFRSRISLYQNLIGVSLYSMKVVLKNFCLFFNYNYSVKVYREDYQSYHLIGESYVSESYYKEKSDNIERVDIFLRISNNIMTNDQVIKILLDILRQFLPQEIELFIYINNEQGYPAA